MRVLLVDEESDFLEEAEVFLPREDERLNVETATSARDALKLLDEGDFDGVVSGSKMPDMDGLELLRTLREERSSDIPFILFAGGSREEAAAEALNLGADRYLQKGEDPSSQHGALADAIVDEVEQRQAEEGHGLQEAYLQGLFEGSPEAIVLAHDDGRVIRVNESFEEMFQYRNEEIEGRCIDELVVPEDRVEEAERITRVTADGGEVKRETVRKRKDGSPVDVSLVTSPIKFSGEQVGVFGIYRDITERKKAEEEHREYRTAVDASDDSVYMIDRNCRYVFANDEHVSRLANDGKIPRESKEEVVGRKYGDIHPPGELETLKRNIEKILKTGELRTERYEFLTEDRWSSRTYSPVRNPETGDVEGVVVVSKNITERVKAEDREELLHSLLRHDVRNKAQIAQGYHELLRDFELTEEAKRYVEKASDAVRGSIELIEKVRTLREIGEKEEVGEVSVGKAIKNAISESEPRQRKLHL